MGGLMELCPHGASPASAIPSGHAHAGHDAATFGAGMFKTPRAWRKLTIVTRRSPIPFCSNR
jgi:hypothetical protein